MRIEIMMNQQACLFEIEAGMLLSELLETRGWKDQAVSVDGRQVDCRLMLAAQAHGREIDLHEAVVELPLQELLLAPEHSPAAR